MVGLIRFGFVLETSVCMYAIVLLHCFRGKEPLIDISNSYFVETVNAITIYLIESLHFEVVTHFEVVYTISRAQSTKLTRSSSITTMTVDIN